MRSITTREGIEIFYRDDYLGPPWQRAQAQTVVLLHGIAESSSVWYAWIAALAPRYRVIAPDFPGHGLSRIGEGVDYAWTPERLAGDAHQLVQALGLGPVHVVGAKYGASIALQFAAQYPAEVRSLSVVSGPVQVAGTPGAATVQASLARVRSAGLRTWVAESMPQRLGSGAPPEQHGWWTDHMAATDLRAVCGCLDEFSRLDLRAQLPRVRAPALIVTTRGNSLMALEPFKTAAASLADGRLVVLEGDCYHPAAVLAGECIAAVAPHILAHENAGG